MGYAENQARVEQGRMKSLHDFQKQPQMAAVIIYSPLIKNKIAC